MPMSEKQAVQDLQTRPCVFVAYSQATRLPYVTCDEESANDQVWIFSTEEGIKAFGQKKAQDRVPILGMKYEQKDYNRLYALLFSIDANAVVWNDGEEKVEVELEKIARRADFSKLPPEKQPLLNPPLQLCGIYFMQELRRPRKEGDPVPNLRDQEEEFLHNLRQAQLLVPMEVSPEDPKKISVPYLKNKNGDMLQPAFTDVMELERFARGKKLRAARVSFDKLPGLLLEQSKAMVINPMGFNLPLNRDQLAKIIGPAKRNPQSAS